MIYSICLEKVVALVEYTTKKAVFCFCISFKKQVSLSRSVVFFSKRIVSNKTCLRTQDFRRIGSTSNIHSEAPIGWLILSSWLLSITILATKLQPNMLVTWEKNQLAY